MAGLVPAVQADIQASTGVAAAGKPPARTPASAAAPAQTPVAGERADVAEVDGELLEFLGSVDSETGDQDWIDYLSQTDIAKVAKGKSDD